MRFNDHRRADGSAAAGRMHLCRLISVAAIAGLSLLPVGPASAVQTETIHGVWDTRVSECAPIEQPADGNWTVVMRDGESPVVHVNLFRSGEHIAAWGINDWVVTSTNPLVLAYAPFTLTLEGATVHLAIDFGCPHAYLGHVT